MKKVKELLEQSAVQEELTIEKLPKEGVRLLYVAPSLNSEGYYRMILPFLELGTLPEFETRVTSVTKWDFAKTYTIDNDTLKEEEIQWADYIIFPMLTKSYTYLFQAIRILNPKVCLVMDVTRQIHKIPKAHADHTIYTAEQQENLLKNILQMNMVTTAIPELRIIYQNWLWNCIQPKSRIEVYYVPNLISKIGFEGIKEPVTKPDKSTIRVGMIGSDRSASDYKYFKTVFKHIKEKYKDQVELVIFGWNGKNPKGSEALKGIDVTYHKSVSFLEYYQTLKNLRFDILLIPMRSLEYYKYASTIQFLEAAAIGVPVVALRSSSFGDIIDDGKNGLLAWKLPEWEPALLRLIDDAEFRKTLGANAKQWVWKHRGYTPKNLEIYKRIFR